MLESQRTPDDQTPALTPPLNHTVLQALASPLKQPLMQGAPARQSLAAQGSLVLDACVLMSGLLRPLLLDLAEADVFVPLWTDKIGSEWMRNAARLWPIDPEVLRLEWQIMQDRFPAANMGDVTEFEVNLHHTDRKDKHVAAAGVAAVARTIPGPVSILTWNIKDFSRSELRKQQLGLMDPDRLLSLWWPLETQTLQAHIERTAEALFASGRRQPEPVVNLLRRDRLHRLAACYERQTSTVTTVLP